MPRYEYIKRDFRVTHTIEETGPHPSIPYDYYEDTFAITIMLHGSGICYIEGNYYSLTEGSIVVFSPDDIHSFRFSQEGYHERLSIYLSGALLSGFSQHQLDFIRIFRDFTSRNKYLYTAESYDKTSVFQMLNDLCSTMKDNEIGMQEARIHIILLRLLFVLYDCRQADSDSIKTDAQNSVIAEICLYIKEHLQEPLSYQDIENHFFVSNYQLTKKFRDYTGMSLTKYIIVKRLMNVVSMVRNGNGIEAAAHMSGFNTYSHFYKEFMKYFNKSPKMYFGTED